MVKVRLQQPESLLRQLIIICKLGASLKKLMTMTKSGKFGKEGNSFLQVVGQLPKMSGIPHLSCPSDFLLNITIFLDD